MATAPEPNISSPKDLEDWLKDKPVEWAQAIAARAALRVFPAVLRVADREGGENLILQTFRASSISWAARKYPAHDMATTATAAAAAAFAAFAAADVDADAAANAAAFAADAAAFAADAAAANADAFAAAAANAAANAAAAAFATDAAAVRGQTWAAIEGDCHWLTKYEGNLIDRQLWLFDVRSRETYAANLPDWARRPLDTFAPRKATSDDPFRLIADWYRAIIGNLKGRDPRSLFGERADVELATQPEDFWTISEDRSAGQIMQEIADVVGGGGASTAAADKPMTQHIMEYLDREVEPRTIDDIRVALAEAGIEFIDKSMRGTLSLLAKKGRIKRVRTGVYQRAEPKTVPVPPPQGHGPHLGVAEGQIAFAPVSHTGETNTDFGKVERLLPFVREALESFLEATPPCAEGSNDPFHREKRMAGRYLEASSSDVASMDFDLLFGAGTSLMNRLAAEAQRSLESDLPPLSDAQRLALEDFQSSHGPMISATEAGDKAIADAEKVIRNPEEEQQFRQTVIEFMEALKAERNIAKPEVADFLQDVAAETGTGHQAERSLRFALGAARNTTIVLTSVGTMSALPIVGTAIAGPVGAIAGAVLSYILWEATKKSKPFGEAIKPITAALDGLSEMDQQKLALLIDSGTSDRFARFALKEEERLRAIAGDRPEFRWLHEQLDFMKANQRR